MELALAMFVWGAEHQMVACFSSTQKVAPPRHIFSQYTSLQLTFVPLPLASTQVLSGTPLCLLLLHVPSLASGHRAARALGDHWKIQGDPFEILCPHWRQFVGKHMDKWWSTLIFWGILFSDKPAGVRQRSLDTVWICWLKNWQICSLKNGQLPRFPIHDLIDYFSFLHFFSRVARFQGRPAKLHHHGPMT